MLPASIWLLTGAGIIAHGVLTQASRKVRIHVVIGIAATAGAAAAILELLPIPTIVRIAVIGVAWLVLAVASTPALGSRLPGTLITTSVVLFPTLLELSLDVPPATELKPLGIDGLWLLNGLFLGALAVVVTTGHREVMSRRTEWSVTELDRRFVGLYLLAGCLGLAGFSAAALTHDATYSASVPSNVLPDVWPAQAVMLAGLAAVCLAVAVRKQSRIAALLIAATGAVASVVSLALIGPQVDPVAGIVSLLVVAAIVDSQLSAHRLNFRTPRFESVWIAVGVGVAVAAPLASIVASAVESGHATATMAQFIPWAIAGTLAVVYTGSQSISQFARHSITQNSPSFNLFHDWLLVLGAYSLGALLPVLAPRSGTSTLVFLLGILSVSGINALIVMIMRNTVEHPTDETSQQLRNLDTLTPEQRARFASRLKGRATRHLAVAAAIAALGWGYFVLTSTTWMHAMSTWLSQLGAHLVR